ncbi:MAG: hypothetical protein HUJ54_13185 [Erysipelotrichaceae bacterium]|nr:hypothetical protein [Erysipelotrichaceae bacterium]
MRKIYAGAALCGAAVCTAFVPVFSEQTHTPVFSDQEDWMVQSLASEEAGTAASTDQETSAIQSPASEEGDPPVLLDQEASQDQSMIVIGPSKVPSNEVVPGRFYFIKNNESQYGLDYPGVYCQVKRVFEENLDHWGNVTFRHAEVYLPEYQANRTYACDNYSFFAAPQPDGQTY